MEYYSQGHRYCSLNLAWPGWETQFPVSESETRDCEHIAAPSTHLESLQERPSTAPVGCLGALVCLEDSDCFLDLTTQHKGEKLSFSSVKLHCTRNSIFQVPMWPPHRLAFKR